MNLRARREELRARLGRQLDAMPPSAAKQLALAVLEGATLEEIDAEVIRDLGDEPSDPEAADRVLEASLLAKRGDAPGLGVLFEQAADDVDASWGEIAATFAELCDSGESSSDLTAVAVLFALAASSWHDVVTRASALGATDDRLGRLAQAAAASKLGGDEPMAFLRSEAAHFFASLHERATDTGALASVALLRQHDEVTIVALGDALRANAPHGVAGRALVGLMGPDPAFGAPLEILVAGNFGRPAEGEPVAYAAMLAKAAPERARALVSAATEIPERRAAALAGAIVADHEDPALRDEARGLLETLDPKHERQAAAALALLRAMHEANVEGFAEAAARWRSVERSKHVGAALTRWFDRHGSEIR